VAGTPTAQPIALFARNTGGGFSNPVAAAVLSFTVILASPSRLTREYFNGNTRRFTNGGVTLTIPT
jgi:hypothetical protein